ncbi:hypothetical protein [Variovorax sp. PAMC 28711]|uniref:hypothetical protein n=1 Tax=Variovorax sp. PAMC 28711 TaxID=1795631 RepID=UPI00078C2FD6|nr:hypothetical protein [Variovorax sp. PAMC 28711]AMM25417.1 hypothetical protein AX767_14415 [Variovorax sp. PAMC 28711]
MAEPTNPHHLLIPFAGRNAPGCLAALPGLRLPNLEALLAHLTLDTDDTQDDTTRSPPHERAMARALGITAADGCIPWAALEARRSGLADPDDTEAWGFATLCHWRVEVDDIVLGDPDAIGIDAEESAALLAAAQPFFEEDGIALHATATPGQWLARGKPFAQLATASIDRVIGGAISPWAPATDSTRALRRLQNEMQMLLYTERVNDDRTRRGAPPINSFWLSGTGALPAGKAVSAAEPPTVAGALRGPALADDGPAWAEAWRAIDAGALAGLLAAHTRGEAISLTLCGDRAAQRFTPQKIGWGRRLKNLFGRQPAAAVLGAL